MRAYIINLDHATERWSHIQNSFGETNLTLERVSAVDGRTMSLPDARFAEGRFRWSHGRETNIFEVACYLSHLKALEQFLATGDEMALIGEDDVVPGPALDAVLAAALHYKNSWNILRLTGLSGGGVQVVGLSTGHALAIHTKRLKGAGAYLVDRRAAQSFLDNLLPMRLPYDHAFDREWVFGLRAMAVTPFPISQTEKQFRSSIQRNSKPRLSFFRRLIGTYPYQAYNEISRSLFRWGRLLGLKFHFGWGTGRALRAAGHLKSAAQEGQ